MTGQWKVNEFETALVLATLLYIHMLLKFLPHHECWFVMEVQEMGVCGCIFNSSVLTPRATSTPISARCRRILAPKKEGRLVALLLLVSVTKVILYRHSLSVYCLVVWGHGYINYPNLLWNDAMQSFTSWLVLWTLASAGTSGWLGPIEITWHSSVQLTCQIAKSTAYIQVGDLFWNQLHMLVNAW